MKLRPYQERAVRMVRDEVSRGSRSILVVSPTGSGKTVLFSHIARRHIELGSQRRVVVLVHRRELIEQTTRKLMAFGIPLGSVLVHTVQSLLARAVEPPTMLILDEAHHYVSDEWRKVADRTTGAVTLGFTATPERGDGKGLGDLFQSMVVVTQPGELVDSGALCPCDIIAPPDRLGGGEIAQLPVDAYREHGGGGSAIVFAPTVAIAQEYTEQFVAAGVSALTVWGAMPSAERDEAIRRFRDQDVRVLVNCMVLTEGFDAPHAAVCILSRGAGTAGTYLQMVGRVLRPHPSKGRATLIDLVGASHQHGGPLDDRAYSLQDGILKRNQERAEHSFCPVCGATWAPPKCDGCGHESETVTQVVTNSPLVKYERKRREGDEARAFTLARWIREGRMRGFKPGWAKYKYKAVYGEHPPANILDAALYVVQEVA